MSEPIIAAIIGAGGVILAAIIGLLAKSKKATKTTINQKAQGSEITQIGISIENKETNNNGRDNH